MRVAIYARVSTADKGQDIEMQLHDLRAYCVARQWSISGEYVDDGISGAKTSRKALNDLMSAAKQRQIDAVLVWKLNRFSRSMIHLVSAVNELQAVGVQFVSLKDAIDFTTPAGKLQFHMLAALAEFERDTIRENVRAGLANAKRKGKKLGRKPVPPITLRKIIDAHQADDSLSVRAIAKLTKQSVGLVHKTISLFRAGKLDSDGFFYESPLVDKRPL
jgi:DNA invertase Pin-like site-specific DNA recombinase